MFNLAMLKAGAKWFGVAASILLVMLAFYGTYQHGYDVAVKDNTIEQAKALEKAVEKAKKDWEAQHQITLQGIQNVQNTKTEIRYIERKAEKIEAPLCSDVGSDFVGVYNDAIQAIQSGTDSSRVLPYAKVPDASFDATPAVN